MKRVFRWLALALALAMLTALCGTAEEIVIDAEGTGELFPEDATVPEGLELEGDALSPEGLAADLDLALDIDLEDGTPEPGEGAEAFNSALPGAAQANEGESQWSALQKRLDDASDFDYIALTEDVTASPEDRYLRIPAGKNITLDLAGCVLDRGLTEPTDMGCALYVMGELWLQDSVGGGAITGGNNKSSGGAIIVGDGGHLMMNSGEVRGNQAENGGGVYVRTGGRFTMSGGAIRDNTANSIGGGVCASGMDESRPFVELYGGEITGNSAEHGGGVYTANSDMTMYPQFNIRGNKATNAGGVYVSVGSHCTLKDGAISGNTASERGGGLFVYGGESGASLEILNGAYVDNNQAKQGGGIYCCHADITLDGGSVSGNTGTATCGGIALNQSTLNILGGNIENNIADTGTGGGVSINNESICLGQGGYIRGNTAALAGGVFIGTGCRFEMQSGLIEGNTAKSAGGVLVGYKAEFNLSGGFIMYNTATDCGGVLGYKYAVMEMTGGFISENRAAQGSHGGGLDISSGTLRVSGHPHIHSNYCGDDSSNCYLHYSKDGSYRICVTGALDSDAFLYVDYPSWTNGNTVYPITDGLGAGGNLNAFKCSDFDYTVRWNAEGTEAEIVPMSFLMPTPTPTAKPTPTPTPKPTATPTPKPTATPTAKPTATLTAKPTATPTPKPTATPKAKPTASPTSKPTATPTPKPTATPKVKLSKCKVSAVDDRVYTGKAIKPALTVKYGGKALKKGTDYTIAYSNNKAVGLAKVTVTGKGKFTGKRTVSFRILPRSTAISKLTAGKGKVTISWGKRAEGGGYRIQYGLKSSFSGAKTLTVKKAGATKATIKGLPSGKTVYFRVRAYKTVNGKTYYSAWSKAKRVKVK